MSDGPKYFTPKIILIDMPRGSENGLRSAGFNVSVGSFGRPYAVENSTDVVAVVENSVEPEHLQEMDIVVVDLTPSPLGKIHEIAKRGETRFWMDCRRGVIDPRSLTALAWRDRFDRILAHGGVFILFAEPRLACQFGVGHLDSFGRPQIEERVDSSTWDFLSLLQKDTIGIFSDSGTEITVPPTQTDPIAVALSRRLNGASFSCGFIADEISFDDVSVIALNKFGNCVAMRLDCEAGGMILVMPQLHDKAGFVLDLLRDVLPETHPNLFPHFEGGKWVHQPEYEISPIRKLELQIEAIQADAQKRIDDLGVTIEREREENKHLYNLVRGTDSELVDAVKWALGVVGFARVEDVDQKMKEDGEGQLLREDLQIHDVSPILIVDVKGIGGHPSDPDAMQSQKHAAMRIQEWKNPHVQALSIINHQRRLPGLDRDNDMPFRNEIVTAAKQLNVGLLTGWDLHRLVRNILRLKWKPEWVKPVFYKVGRIEAVPTHYRYVGKIVRTWRGGFGIQIDEGELRTGDRIVVEFPIEFEEADIASMQIDDEDADVAPIGSGVGIRLQSSMVQQIRLGYRVFRVDRGQT